MNEPLCKSVIISIGVVGLSILLAGCGTAAGNAAADLGLAGAGGAIGYQVSAHRIGSAAAGAALGYLGSRVAQSESQRAVNEAEQRGYDRAMNQAVKQQYWIMQRQQREPRTDEPDARLTPVVVPETTVNGVIQNARVEHLRVAP